MNNGDENWIDRGFGHTRSHSAAASPPPTDFCTNTERASSTRSRQFARHLRASFDAVVLSLNVLARATRVERLSGSARTWEPTGILQRFFNARRASAASEGESSRGSGG